MADPPDATPSPPDLDAIGSRYNIPLYRMEELVSLRQGGASDVEILAAVRTPSDDGALHAEPIPLTNDEARELLAALARLGA